MEIKMSIAPETLSRLANKPKEVELKLRTALQETATLEVTNIQRSISTSKTGPDGIPWQPWSTATMRQKGKRLGGLMYRTGALLKGIRAQIFNSRIRISSDVPYSRYLQFGTPKMPARPFMGWRRDTLNTFKNKAKKAFQ